MTMIVTLEENHTYTCNHSATNAITWKLNDLVLGVHIRNHSGINYTDILTHPGGDEVYTLTIRALPRYNNTSIKCTAAFYDGSSSEDTPPVFFLIQGCDSFTIFINFT